MLDLRRLALLEEVARSGSFSAAAKKLSFTPSAVSQQIAAFERELGTPLFERGPRGVRLTEAGRALHAHAEGVLARAADARAEVDAIAGGTAGRLRMGCFPTATTAFGARAVEVFRSRYPEVKLDFVGGEPFETLRRLRARELDLSVLFDLDRWSPGTNYDGELVCAPEEAEYIELFEDPYLVVMPRLHRLATQRSVKLAELAHETIMGSQSKGPPWTPDLLHICRRAGFTPHLEPGYRTADFQETQAFVAAGSGLTVLPRLGLLTVRPDVVVRPLEPTFARHVKIAKPAGAYLSTAAKAMVAILREVVEALNLEGWDGPAVAASGGQEGAHPFLAGDRR